MNRLRKLLIRIHCELTDHEHRTAPARRGGKAIPGRIITECRRGCGWWVYAR